MKTIITGYSNRVQDDFIRTVSFVLRSHLTAEYLLISPYEANELYKNVKLSHIVSMHIYPPRIRRSQHSFETCDYCLVGSGLDTQPAARISSHDDVLIVRQLNLFAGQMVFQTENDYHVVCDFLAFYTGRSKGSERDVLMTDEGDGIELGPS